MIVEELLTYQRLGDLNCIKMWSDLRKGAPMKQTYCSALSISQDALQDRCQTWSTQHILICCVCLGDNSEDADEIIQCDNCGVTVHEGKLSYSCLFHLSPAIEGWEQFVSWLLVRTGSAVTLKVLSSMTFPRPPERRGCQLGCRIQQRHPLQGALSPTLSFVC